MSYDAASFKAGFAVGRMLWRPPTLRGDQDTGLGWSADPTWLAYAAGTDLGTSNERHFYKANDGYAIAVYAVDAEGNWRGPVLISTNLDYVATNYVRSGDQFTYLGLTWYVYHGYHYINATYTTPLRIWTDWSGNWPETAKQIMQAAKVRVHFV